MSIQDLQSGYQKAVIKNPELPLILHEYERGLTENYYSHANWFGQLFYGTYPTHEVFAFAQLHAMALSGDIVFARVEVGDEPSNDNKVYENNNKLRSLPEGFTGIFQNQKGRSATDDGLFLWDIEITLNSFDYLGNKHEVKLKPGFANLEVGYTNFTTTLLHLKTSRVLARWPYCSKDIILMAIPENHHYKYMLKMPYKYKRRFIRSAKQLCLRFGN